MSRGQPPTQMGPATASGLCSQGAVIPGGAFRQSGRCGILTRILVDTVRDRRTRPGVRAAVISGPERTTRLHDEAAASRSCRFQVLVPLCTRGIVTVTPV